jgi:hypothetical protein
MTPKSIAIVVAIAVVAAIAYPQIRKSRESGKVSSAEYLTGVENSYKLRVPFTPRPNMIVYKVEIIEGVLNYGVRIDNVNEGNVMEPERANIRRAVTSMLCEEKEATALRKGGMTVRASIGDRTGTPITTVAVLPNGC